MYFDSSPGSPFSKNILGRLEVFETTQVIFLDVLVSGMICAGLVTLFGLGVGVSIELFKSFGGVR